MSELQIRTARLDLRPLKPEAAAALPQQRDLAAELIAARLPDDWPAPDLLDVLPMQAAAGELACFGVWVVIEHDSNTVIGDIGFFGPPTSDATVEVGYSIIPARRRRGYATEAGSALINWALEQRGIESVVAGCDPENLPSTRTLERLGFSQTEANETQLRWRLRAT